MRLGLHGVGKQLSYFFYLVTFGRVMKRVWYLPGRHNQGGHMGPVCNFFILGNGKALRKMQSSALVRRYSCFFNLAKG